MWFDYRRRALRPPPSFLGPGECLVYTSNYVAMGLKSDDQDDRSRQKLVGRGVIGVLARGPRLLVVRRSPGVALGGYWCFPGGHVEPGETPRAAIRRELAEELGIDTVPTQRVGAVRTDDERYVLAVWLVEQVGGELRAAQAEICDFSWLTPGQIRALRPGLRSTERVLELLDV